MWSVSVFHKHSLGGEPSAERAIRSALPWPCISSFILCAKLSRVSTGRFSRFFDQMEGICMSILDPVQFFDSSRDVAMATNFVSQEKHKPCSIFAIFNARCGIYISCLCYNVTVRLSLCLSVCPSVRLFGCLWRLCIVVTGCNGLPGYLCMLG